MNAIESYEIKNKRGRTRIEVIDRIDVGVMPSDGTGVRHEASWETVNFVKLTRQGVRDLNGPHMNGTGYNGHKNATCIHHKTPDLTPRHTLIETVADEHGLPRDMRYDCCSLCGERLGEVDR